MSTQNPRSFAVWPPPPARKIGTDPNEPPQIPLREWIANQHPIRIQVVWVEQDGRQVPEQVTLRAWEGQTLNASRIHQIPFGHVFDRMKAGQGELTQQADLSPDRIKELREAWAKPRVGRKPKYDPDHWLSVRKVWLEGHSRNKGRQAIVATFGVTESTARNWVANMRHKLKIID